VIQPGKRSHGGRGVVSPQVNRIMKLNLLTGRYNIPDIDKAGILINNPERLGAVCS